MKLPRIFYNILFLPLFAFGSLETDVEQINSYTFNIYNKQISIDSGVRNIMNDVEAIADRFVQETTARTSFRSSALSSLESIDSKLTNLASPKDYSSQLNKMLSFMGSDAYTTSQRFVDLNLFKFLFGSPYYAPSNTSLNRGGVYGMIDDILQELKSKNFSPNISITNSVNPVFSITNIVNSPSIVITNDVNPIFNITNDVNPTFSITNNVNVVLTNTIPLCYDTSIITNILDVLGLINSSKYASESGYENIYQKPLMFNLTPFYFASGGIPFDFSISSSSPGYMSLFYNDYSPLLDKVLAGVSSSGKIKLKRQLNEFTLISDALDPESNNIVGTYKRFAVVSEYAKEKLYGTYDIEEMFRFSTNHIAEISKIVPKIDDLQIIISNGFDSVIFTLSQFTNLMQNVSLSSLVNSNQFAGALQDSVDTMPAAFTDTSVTSISNATIYATEDNGYSTLLNENAVDLNAFDYSRFETSVRSFVQVWESGVNVGLPTLNIHFAGVDTGQGNPTLEQTIDLDFELPQSAKDKISAFWSAVFALIRGSLILWGFFRLFNAVLNANRRESSTGHTDFTNVDID